MCPSNWIKHVERHIGDVERSQGGFEWGTRKRYL